MWPWLAGPAPRLTDPRIEAEVGRQLAPIREAVDVADGGHERRRDDHVDAGDGHQPLDLGPPQRVGGDELVDLRDLRVEEVDLAQAGIDGLALAGRQLLIVQPGPAFDAEEVRSRRTVLQAPHQDGVDLVFDPRARPDQLRAAGQPAAHRADALIRRPDPIELARPQQLGQGAGIEPVGLGPGLADAGVAR